MQDRQEGLEVIHVKRGGGRMNRRTMSGKALFTSSIRRVLYETHLTDFGNWLDAGQTTWSSSGTNKRGQ
jgi:hypothetical protein